MPLSSPIGTGWPRENCKGYFCASPYTTLPEELRGRYAPAQARLFAEAKTAEARARRRQQAAEDLHFLITRFAERADLTGRSTSNALVTIFDQQCELRDENADFHARELPHNPKPMALFSRSF